MTFKTDLSIYGFCPQSLVYLVKNLQGTLSSTRREIAGREYWVDKPVKQASRKQEFSYLLQW